MVREVILGVTVAIGIGFGLAAAGDHEHTTGQGKKKVECDCCKKEGKTAQQALSGAADVKEFPSCSQCGMHRDKFAHSRAFVEFTDGSCAATCSIGCVADELKAAPHKKVKLIRVADYATRELIEAEKAFWVIGGDVSGVMTRNPKWAFADKTGAEAFVKEHGGRLASFTEVWQAAQGE